MAVDELIVRAALRDELSRPLAAVRAELKQTREELGRLSQQSKRTDDVRGLTNAFGGLTRQLGSVDSGLRNVSSSLRSQVTSAVTGTATAIGTATLAAGAFGLKSAASFEQSRIAMGALLGSVDKGNALFAQLQQYNLSTPFNLPQVTQATQTLLQFGFAGDQVMGVVKSLGDVAATSADPSESLNRMAFAIGQIKTAGVLRAQDLNQLVQAGFPAYQVVQQLSGLSGKQLRDQMQAGNLNVDADQFVNALTSYQGVLGNRRGAAAKQNATLTGQWSNFTDTLRMNLATAMQPLVGYLETEMPHFSTMVGTFLTAVGPEVNSLLELMMKTAEAALPVVQPIMSALLGGVGGFLAALGPSLSGLAPLGGQLGAAIGQLFTDLAADAPDFGAAIVALVGVLPEVVKLFDDMLPALDVIAKLLSAIVSNDAGRDAFAGLLIVLMGYSMLSGAAKAILTMAAALDVLTVSEEANAAAGGGGIPGRLPSKGSVGKVAKGAGGLLGLLGLGTGVYSTAQNGAGFGNFLTTVGGGAAAGSMKGGWLGVGAGALLGTAAWGGAALGHSIWGSKDAAPPASPSGPAFAQTVNIPQGAIVVNNPTSNVDVEQAFRNYFADRAARGLPVPTGMPGSGG